MRGMKMYGEWIEKTHVENVRRDPVPSPGDPRPTAGISVAPSRRLPKEGLSMLDKLEGVLLGSPLQFDWVGPG
jgi:hypothetical protein